MKKRKIVIILLLTLTLAVGTWAAYTFIPKSIDKQVTLKCRYMAYACGDCYPQYRVDEVIIPSSGNLQEDMLKKEISVFYKAKELENHISKETSKCIICYDFYFSGELKQSASKGYFLEVDSAKIELRPNCCSEKD